VKLAVIEAEWETQKAPASFTAFGFPNDAEGRTDHAIRIPWLLGLIATRSVTGEVTGIKELKEDHLRRIERGALAYAALQKLRGGDKSAETRAAFEANKDDLGFGLLLKKYTANVVDATPEQKRMAADDTIPKVAPMFWSFRFMVGLGMWFLFIFAASFFFLARRNLSPQRWLLRLAMYSIPLPWVASELGWIVAEYGRQPWTISGVLPTSLSVSSLPVSSVYASLAAFVLFYTALFVVEMYLMLKYVRLGPSSLGTGRYFGEPGAPVHGAVARATGD
jgi:cytochrome d ubiquinol oxidase subunit I